MSTTTKAAVHLGPNCNDNLEVFRNTNFEELKNFFDITQRLILEHEVEILNVSTIDWKASSWTRSARMHDQVIKCTKAEVHVHSDSVLCLEKMQDHSEANERWNAQLEEFNNPTLTENYLESMDNQLSSNGIFSQDLRHWKPPKRSNIICKIKKIEPEHFEGRIIFMSMCNDIDWTQ